VQKSLLFGLGAGFVLIIATACGSGAATPVPHASSAAAPSAAAVAPKCAPGVGTGQQVAAANTTFTPSSISVGAGGTVTWTNGDSFAHTVTFDNGPDCGQLAPAASITVTFAAAGIYAFHCTIHSSMKGTVTVS
jgi:plastocyanin